ncbi:hypothetical protein AB0J14_08170 [Micromonospora arborensis]|uniref:hypothetical protein n=1 Tax=Micromonospora arborensis TaxID=2116518 RepID=UPI0033E5388A
MGKPPLSVALGAGGGCTRGGECVDRVQRAPGVAVGAIDAALYSEASNLRNLGRHLVRRRQGLR